MINFKSKLSVNKCFIQDYWWVFRCFFFFFEYKVKVCILLKWDSDTGVFLLILWNFLEHLLYRKATSEYSGIIHGWFIHGWSCIWRFILYFSSFVIIPCRMLLESERFLNAFLELSECSSVENERLYGNYKRFSQILVNRKMANEYNS